MYLAKLLLPSFHTFIPGQRVVDQSRRLEGISTTKVWIATSLSTSLIQRQWLYSASLPETGSSSVVNTVSFMGDAGRPLTECGYDEGGVQLARCRIAAEGLNRQARRVRANCDVNIIRNLWRLTEPRPSVAQLPLSPSSPSQF